ncbi:MAG: thymidylate kinase [Armatimonadota bacterium]|nr:MAG: thymidylate kinase [Armatimonadota bacterium]
MSALFITFEGIEGAGKTTLARWLSERLLQEGIPNWLTHEPWEPRLRQVLLEHSDLQREEELLLFLADRAIHTRHIRQTLAEGKKVICDRYADSTLVYQGYARGLDVEWVRQLNRFATGGLQPIRTYLLDLPVEIGLRRQRERNRIGAEEIAFHERVREGFLTEARREPQRYLVLDAMRPLEELQGIIWEDVSGLLV